MVLQSHQFELVAFFHHDSDCPELAESFNRRFLTSQQQSCAHGSQSSVRNDKEKDDKEKREGKEDKQAGQAEGRNKPAIPLLVIPQGTNPIHTDTTLRNEKSA